MKPMLVRVPPLASLLLARLESALVIMGGATLQGVFNEKLDDYAKKRLAEHLVAIVVPELQRANPEYGFVDLRGGSDVPAISDEAEEAILALMIARAKTRDEIINEALVSYRKFWEFHQQQLDELNSDYEGMGK